jgi:hypothetical protein
MDTNQRTKLFMLEIRTLLVRDLKLVHGNKLVHMLRLQVYLAAVSIKKVLWARTTWIDSTNTSKPNLLIKFRVKDLKFQKLSQEYLKLEAKLNLRLLNHRNSKFTKLTIKEVRKKLIKLVSLSIISQSKILKTKRSKPPFKKNNMTKSEIFQDQTSQLLKCRIQPNQNWAKCPVKHTFLNFKNN